MTIVSNHEAIRSEDVARHPAAADHGLSAYLATLVLAWATGAPLRSAEHVLPHSGEQAAPYLGV